MAQIRLVNVSKRWGSYVGVDNFNLDIADAEFLVLLGPWQDHDHADDRGA